MNVITTEGGITVATAHQSGVIVIAQGAHVCLGSTAETANGSVFLIHEQGNNRTATVLPPRI